MTPCSPSTARSGSTAAKRSSRGVRPGSASTATRCCATPAMTRDRSSSCGPRARWLDRAGPAIAQTGNRRMATYRLHYFPESGNSYKLALMLTLCGQTFEPVWTDFGGGATRSADWRGTVNAMGEIPVLEEDGARLTQTGPILLRLAEQYGRF